MSQINKNLEEILENLQNPSTQHVNIKENILRILRTDNECPLTISELKFQFENKQKITSIICFIKSVFTYNEDVSVLILGDETGQIKANIYSRIVNEQKIIPNRLIMIKECSIWNINDIQLNVVDENVVEIFN